MIDTIFFKQGELLLRVLPLIDKETAFALKGGTAINFFIRDMPRISIDIDLTYLPVGERNFSLHEISNALIRISQDVESKIPGTKVIVKKIKGTDFLHTLFVQSQEATIKIEPNLVKGISVLSRTKSHFLKGQGPLWRFNGMSNAFGK